MDDWVMEIEVGGQNYHGNRHLPIIEEMSNGVNMIKEQLILIN